MMPADEVTAISRTPGKDVQARAAKPAAVVITPSTMPTQIRATTLSIGSSGASARCVSSKMG